MNSEKFEIEFITIEPIENIADEVKPIIHHKNSRRNKTKITLSREEYEEIRITWKLIKFMEEQKHEWGFPQSSAQKLSNGITVEKIVLFLNHSKKIFDFEYKPNENDLLTIGLEYTIKDIKGKYSRPYIGEYISFLYNGEKWLINEGFDHLNNKYEDFKEGILKYVI